MGDDKHPLNSDWVLWYHKPSDKNWGRNSYKKIFEIKTIEDFWLIHKKIQAKHIENGMYFLMRKEIFPLWEDEKNVDGGSWSFKIDKKLSYNSWIEISMSVLGETVMNDSDLCSNINGISISPKKGFCILKIWNSDKNKSDKSLLKNDIPYIKLDGTIYKSHK